MDHVSEQSDNYRPLDSVWGSSPNDVFVVGGKGEIWRTADQGASWNKQSSGVTGNLYRVWGANGGDVFVVGSAGTVLHTTNSGTTWTPETSNTSQDLYCVWGSAGNDVYAVGTSGAIIHSAGGAWTQQRIATLNDRLTTVWGLGAGNILASYPGTLLHSTGNGTWTNVSAEITGIGIYRLWGTGNDFIGVNTMVVYHSGDSGLTWDQQPTGATAGNAVWGASPTNVYAVGSGGTIIHGQ